MHGIILAELQRYIETNVGPHSWQETCRQAKVGRSSYTIFDTYPDGDLPALLGAGSRLIGVAVPDLLEHLGNFIVPGVMQRCERHVPRGWGAIELIGDLDRSLTLAMRLTGRPIEPPQLRTERVSLREVRIFYGSPRQLCGLTRGIVRGLLSHYREIGTIKETACMLDGAAQCEITVTRLAS